MPVGQNAIECRRVFWPERCEEYLGLISSEARLTAGFFLPVVQQMRRHAYSIDLCGICYQTYRRYFCWVGQVRFLCKL